MSAWSISSKFTEIVLKKYIEKKQINIFITVIMYPLHEANVKDWQGSDDTALIPLQQDQCCWQRPVWNFFEAGGNFLVQDLDLQTLFKEQSEWATALKY